MTEPATDAEVEVIQRWVDGVFDIQINGSFAGEVVRKLLSRIAAQDAARVADGVRIAELEAKLNRDHEAFAEEDAKAAAQITRLSNNVDTLRADLAAALEALRPFAEIAKRLGWNDPDDAAHVIEAPADDIAKGAVYCLMICAFVNARALAAKPDGGTNE